MSSGQELERLEEIMRTLRSDRGCPWDREQTHRSLRPYLLEEAYEVLEALEEESPAHLREELGDLLLQVVFHAQLAAESGLFTLADVLAELNAKLLRRHPHVFATPEETGAEAAVANWEEIKAREKAEVPCSALSGVPTTFPALMRAEKVQTKAARVGFDWSEVRGPLAKVKEEAEELVAVWEAGVKSEADQRKLEEEFGDLLFSLVNLARFLKIRPELALLRSTDKFVRRFRYIEERAAAQGQELSTLTLEEMDQLWEEEKKRR
ncbi:MAG TPA: nucleoside triphosphate pyrophosphohydrolase [Hydrogenispora sp.]|jgi:tetrapyrrole methylase family protein/MazG family protein|nr:nucleoside triphosphate pyrophosphohydrolase [Hydrogenispora sp.]